MVMGKIEKKIDLDVSTCGVAAWIKSFCQQMSICNPSLDQAKKFGGAFLQKVFSEIEEMKRDELSMFFHKLQNNQKLDLCGVNNSSKLEEELSKLPAACNGHDLLKAIFLTYKEVPTSACSSTGQCLSADMTHEHARKYGVNFSVPQAKATGAFVLDAIYRLELIKTDRLCELAKSAYEKTYPPVSQEYPAPPILQRQRSISHQV